MNMLIMKREIGKPWRPGKERPRQWDETHTPHCNIYEVICNVQ